MNKKDRHPDVPEKVYFRSADVSHEIAARMGPGDSAGLTARRMVKRYAELLDGREAALRALYGDEYVERAARAFAKEDFGPLPRLTGPLDQAVFREVAERQKANKIKNG